MEIGNAKYIMQNTYLTTPDRIDKLASILSGVLNIDAAPRLQRAVYLLNKGCQIVELVGFSSLDELTALLNAEGLQEDEARLREHMSNDVRREVLKLHTPVKPSQTLIPSTENLQIRYIEVPGCVLPEYFQWRTRTIFSHVLKREDVLSFLAYHSCLSSTPGVTFYVEYEGDYDDLMRGFATPEYKEIIRQADKFIVGGNVNLATNGYHRIYASSSLLSSQLADMEAES